MDLFLKNMTIVVNMRKLDWIYLIAPKSIDLQSPRSQVTKFLTHWQKVTVLLTAYNCFLRPGRVVGLKHIEKKVHIQSLFTEPLPTCLSCCNKRKNPQANKHQAQIPSSVNWRFEVESLLRLAGHHKSYENSHIF